MALFGRDRGRIIPDQTQVLSHPMRLRILELFTRDRERPLDVASIHANLIEDEAFSDVTLSQVSYHLARLKDARLLPTG